jgi:hypothetical protein
VAPKISLWHTRDCSFTFWVVYPSHHERARDFDLTRLAFPFVQSATISIYISSMLLSICSRSRQLPATWECCAPKVPLVVRTKLLKSSGDFECVYRPSEQNHSNASRIDIEKRLCSMTRNIRSIRPILKRSALCVLLFDVSFQKH